jgi:hypothetical protein
VADEVSEGAVVSAGPGPPPSTPAAELAEGLEGASVGGSGGKERLAEGSGD